MFVSEKNPTSKLDKSGKVLIHCSIVVHVPWHTSETMWSSVLRQKKFNLCQGAFHVNFTPEIRRLLLFATPTANNELRNTKKCAM